MNKIYQSSKNWVKRNKKHLLVEASLIGVIALQARGLNSLNQFLKDKNLFDEYYLPIIEELS